MRKITILVSSYLLLPLLAAAQCQGVVTADSPTGATFQRSPANIRVVTWLESKPIAGARVDVLAVSGNSRKLIESLVTDSKGLSTPQTLSAGQYAIHAWAITDGWFTDSEMRLNVSSGAKRDPLTYWMYLTPSTTIAAAVDALVGSASTKALPAKPMREFSGLIQASPGAGIPGAAIEVWNIGSQNQVAAGAAKSGSDGRFQMILPDGSYIARFSEQGFGPRVLVFTIVSSDSPRLERAPLSVSLNPGVCL